MTSGTQSHPQSPSQSRAENAGNGHAGADDAAVRSLDDVLRTQELVKVAISRNVEIKPKELARQLAVAAKAEVIQVIGRTATFYRHNPDLKRKDGKPPWQ